MKVDLSQYVTVNERIIKFYEQYEAGRIITELVSWSEGVIVMKATCYRNNGEVPASTGYAYEVEGSSYINKTSALENCETSAVGRALANLGIEIKKSVASKEEVEQAVHKQELLKQEESQPIPQEVKDLYQQVFGSIDDLEMNIKVMQKKGFTYAEILNRLRGKKQ